MQPPCPRLVQSIDPDDEPEGNRHDSHGSRDHPDHVKIHPSRLVIYRHRRYATLDGPVGSTPIVPKSTANTSPDRSETVNAGRRILFIACPTVQQGTPMDRSLFPPAWGGNAACARDQTRSRGNTLWRSISGSVQLVQSRRSESQGMRLSEV